MKLEEKGGRDFATAINTEDRGAQINSRPLRLFFQMVPCDDVDLANINSIVKICKVLYSNPVSISPWMVSQ